ncbi:MAG: YciI family protein [Gemmatirosa sp.]|nr:YciI family protein [Gemmatirosa sp.]
MQFLCLIHLDEQRMAALPPAEVDDLNRRHLALNDDLRASRHLIAAEALAPSAAMRRVRPRPGQPPIVDGPFTEAKEVVAGFYLIDARDLDEAIAIAARFPGAAHGSVDVWPTRQLVVDATG